jgi:hypothetical protein
VRVAALKSLDLMFHVKLRTMMDMGGAEEEDLVATVKVDSTSLAEGTWTCPDSSKAGQVVLCWDNSFSLLRSKTIAYRTWVVKNDSKAPRANVTATVTATAAAPLAPSPTEEEEMEVTGHTAADQDAAKVAEEAAAAKGRQETALAAEREAAASKAAAAARVAAEKAAADKAAADKAAADRAAAAEEARAAAEKAAAEKAAAEKAAEEARMASEKAAADKAAAVEAEAAAAAAAAAAAEEKAKAEEVLCCPLCLACTCLRVCVRVASSAGEPGLIMLGRV